MNGHQLRLCWNNRDLKDLRPKLAGDKQPIVLRVAIKPTSSLPQPQRTVTRGGEPTEIVTKGRHDPCLLPRFVPMGEAMVAITLADHWLRWRAQCAP